MKRIERIVTERRGSDPKIGLKKTGPLHLGGKKDHRGAEKIRKKSLALGKDKEKILGLEFKKSKKFVPKKKKKKKKKRIYKKKPKKMGLGVGKRETVKGQRGVGAAL